MGFTSARALGGAQHPQCFIDDNGKRRCAVLYDGQSICDEDVQRRLRKLWGADISALAM